MNTNRTSRVDQIIALIDACLADVEGSSGPAAATSASTATSHHGTGFRA